jgi:hypothetical protein
MTLPPFQARVSSQGIQTNVFTKFPAKIGKIREKVGVGPGVGGTEQWTELVKESSADTAWSGWILFVELGNGFFSMQQVLGGFPGVFAFAVALPADKVLELTVVNTTVNDRINFVFFFALNDYRFRRGWLVKTVVVPWAEAADMEDRIQVKVGGELETIVEISDPFEDFVGAELSGPELRRFLMDLDILSRKPDHVSDVEDVGRTFVPLELFLHPFLG